MHSLVKHGGGRHLGTYYRIAGPLIARLVMMGGTTPRKVAADLLSPSEQGYGGGWSPHLLEAHITAVDLQESLSNEDMQMAFLLAPCGLVISLLGDPRSMSNEQAPTVDTDVIPLGRLSPGSTRGIKHVAALIRRLSDWRLFLDILGASPDHISTKLLTNCDHGNVSVLYTNTPHANNVSAEAARVTIRRVTEAPALGHRQCGPTSACPVCDTRGNAKESPEQHAVRCPAGGARAFMHAWLITTLQKVLKEA